MDDTKNALDELAGRLRNQYDSQTSWWQDDQEGKDFDKAQRIIAELAKVQWHDNPNTKVGALPDADSLPNMMVECRAIAEEGADSSK